MGTKPSLSGSQSSGAAKLCQSCRWVNVVIKGRLNGLFPLSVSSSCTCVEETDLWHSYLYRASLHQKCGMHIAWAWGMGFIRTAQNAIVLIQLLFISDNVSASSYQVLILFCSTGQDDWLSTKTKFHPYHTSSSAMQTGWRLHGLSLDGGCRLGA